MSNRLVVRKSGDNQMVGRLMAQRRLRYLYVIQSRLSGRTQLALRKSWPQEDYWFPTDIQLIIDFKDEIFALDELSRVFDADSTPNTHAILASVQDSDDISSVFDAITYGKVFNIFLINWCLNSLLDQLKGAAVLRMLETALGEDNFRTGIKNYLNRYAFENTLTGELWTELTEAHPDVRHTSLDVIFDTIHVIRG